MKATPEIDRRAYELAKGYLPGLNITGVTETLIERYLNPLSLNPRPTSKEELYRRLLGSAQNANMKAGVIGRSIGGVDKLSPILDRFHPEAVTTRYGDDWEAVLDQIVKELKPRGKIRKTPRSIWPLYCQTILSAAAFINQFNDANQFFEWVDFFDRDVRARPSLPMLMDREIKGFGFALSCDFLKELGYVNFAKPDVHLHDIFTELGLCPAKADDYQLFKAIIRLARNADVTPYAADKVFWLIGSGDFYADPEIGSIGSYKQEFIEFAQSKLSDDK
ncbi:MAG: hypothetical protein ACP5OU_08535 [Methanothrix sp.]